MIPILGFSNLEHYCFGNHAYVEIGICTNWINTQYGFWRTLPSQLVRRCEVRNPTPWPLSNDPGLNSYGGVKWERRWYQTEAVTRRLNSYGGVKWEKVWVLLFPEKNCLNSYGGVKWEFILEDTSFKKYGLNSYGGVKWEKPILYNTVSFCAEGWSENISAAICSSVLVGCNLRRGVKWENCNNKT